MLNILLANIRTSVSVIVVFSSAAVARDTLVEFFPERGSLQIRATLALAACLGFSFSIYSSAAFPGTIWANWNVPISCPKNQGGKRLHLGGPKKRHGERGKV